MKTHSTRTNITASAKFKKATIAVTAAAILGAGLTGCVVQRLETDTVYTTTRATASYPSTSYTYYTVDQFHDDFAIEVELKRLKRDSQRRRNEAARAHQNRMNKINRQHDELLRLQKERIRNNDRRLQNQRDEERRRQRDYDARLSNSNQRDRDAKKLQERRDYELAAKLQIEEIDKERRLRAQERKNSQDSSRRQQERRDYELAAKLQMEEIEKERRLREQERHSRDSARQSERSKREADAAERRHVDEVYRQQQKERNRQHSHSSSSSQKSSVQEQIDNDYELAKKLQEEEFAKAMR